MPATLFPLNKHYHNQLDEELYLKAINTELHRAELTAVCFIWLITLGWHSTRNVLNGYSDIIAFECDTRPWKFT